MAAAWSRRRPSPRAVAAAGALAGVLVAVVAAIILLAARSAATRSSQPSGAAGAPLTPQAEEARHAAQTELARPVYREEPDLAQRLWTWLGEHLDLTRAVPGAPAWVSLLVVTLVATLLSGLVLLLVRRTTVARRARPPRTSLFTDDRDAASQATAAHDAASQADYATAVIERYRAIIRSLDEAGLIDDYPGLTATEAARAASSALGATRTGSTGVSAVADTAAGTADRLHEAARLFDAVLYGDVVPSEEQDTWMRTLARDIAQAASTTSDSGVLPSLTLRAGTGGRP